MIFLLPGIISLFKGSSPKNLYDLQVRDLSGNIIPLSIYKGKKLLIVNTASQCGFTHQYKSLQILHDGYHQAGLVVLVFPCNDFGQQEPGNEKEIGEFCRNNYGLTIEIMEKIHVKGRDQHPLYHWLTDKKRNGVIHSRVLWNFQKYLINEQGELVDILAPWTNPTTSRVIKWLKRP